MKRLVILTESQLKDVISNTVRNTINESRDRDESGVQKEWLTNKDVCELLSLSLKTMQNYRDKGIIPFSKIGSKIYYQKSDIDVFLKSHYHSAFNKGRRLS